ncbi:hypothetical protein ES703_25472 [subsurface metagenome]
MEYQGKGFWIVYGIAAAIFILWAYLWSVLPEV